MENTFFTNRIDLTQVQSKAAEIKNQIGTLKQKIDKWPNLVIDPEGAANKPRPLINGPNFLVSPGLNNIGAVVTDITLKNKTTNNKIGVKTREFIEQAKQDLKKDKAEKKK